MHLTFKFMYTCTPGFSIASLVVLVKNKNILIYIFILNDARFGEYEISCPTKYFQLCKMYKTRTDTYLFLNIQNIKPPSNLPAVARYYGHVAYHILLAVLAL